MSPPPEGQAKPSPIRSEAPTARPTRITGWQPPKEDSKPLITGWQPPRDPPLLTRRSRSVSTAATDASGSTSTSNSKGTERVTRPRKARAPKVAEEETDITEVIADPIPRPTRKGKEKALVTVPEVIEVPDDGEEEEDDDMPVFVGSAMAKKLASRFTYQRSSPTSGSTSSRPPPPKVEITEQKAKKPPAKRRTKAEMEEARGGVKVVIAPKLAKKEEAGSEVRWNLLPPLEEQNRGPVPVPQWLGKVQVLKLLPNCPVGMCTWKAKEKSGQSRWAHMTKCLPPLYRPPNDPPDLQTIITDALDKIHASDEPASLLDLHAAAGEIHDRRTHSPTSNSKLILGTGFRSMLRVKAPAGRGDSWEREVLERVDDLTNASPTKRAKLESDMKSEMRKSLSPPPPSLSFPSTQPLGESSLAGSYTRPRTPPPPLSPSISSDLHPIPAESDALPTASQESIDMTAPWTSSPDLPEVDSLPNSPTPSPVLTPASPEPESLSPDTPEQENFPLPPPSQKRCGRFVMDVLSPNSRNAFNKAEPFRGGGSPRADGDFLGKRGSVDGGFEWAGQRQRVVK